eukprot:TRINITY_DN3606_c0_g1_i7.p6 TRINITY_DN3606_c0_g1~~TRINITY_DN3606_c0_g1_i7.p6  ORF type:complete len:107 (+),score=3.28 TRINITY_DN3606_c0_g1_i7:705-1025(+)
MVNLREYLPRSILTFKEIIKFYECELVWFYPRFQKKKREKKIVLESLMLKEDLKQYSSYFLATILCILLKFYYEKSLQKDYCILFLDLLILLNDTLIGLLISKMKH